SRRSQNDTVRGQIAAVNPDTGSAGVFCLPFLGMHDDDDRVPVSLLRILIRRNSEDEFDSVPPGWRVAVSLEGVTRWVVALACRHIIARLGEYAPRSAQQRSWRSV